MAIYFSTENIDFHLPYPEKVKNWITRVVKLQGKRVGEINYLFCDDAYLINVNRTYLNHDTYTDIITFDYVAGNIISGDIMISVDRVAENAQLFNTSFEHELHRVIIHGILHLCGINDKGPGEREIMEAAEDKALAMRE